MAGSADKKPELYTGPDGKRKVRMVPVDRDIDTQQQDQREAAVKRSKKMAAEELTKALEMMKKSLVKQAEEAKPFEMEESATSMDTMKLINKIKKSGVVKDGSMAKKTLEPARHGDSFRKAPKEKEPARAAARHGDSFRKEATIPQGKTVFTSKPPAKIKDSDREKLLKIRQMLDKEKKSQNEEKDTHVTKDGRTVKKGLWYYMNKRKKAGTSRPKSAGTVSPEAMKKSK